MVDPTEQEAQALQVAAMTGGAFVEQVGKTELMQWSEQDWSTLVALIVTAYQNRLRELYLNDPPF